MVLISIDKSMKAQEQAKNIKLLEEIKDKTKFKEYDIEFAGRKTKLLLNPENGEVIVEGLLFRPKVIQEDGFLAVDVSGHEYHIAQVAGEITLDGRIVDFTYMPSVPKLERRTSGASGKEVISAPLPGVIVSVNVAEGDIIQPGEKVITLEAMKMQNELISEKGGRVIRVHVKAQDQVETNQKLVEIAKVKTDEEQD